MSKPAARVQDVRKGAGYADAWFTAVIGYEDEAGNFRGLVSIRDMELRTSQQQERYIKFPSKPRIRKNPDGNTATFQKGPDDKTIYDQVADAALEQVEGKWSPTKEARRFKDLITKQAVDAAGNLKAEANGRGSGARAGAKPRTAVAATTGTSEAGSPLEDDSDLPF